VGRSGGGRRDFKGPGGGGRERERRGDLREGRLGKGQHGEDSPGDVGVYRQRVDDRLDRMDDRLDRMEERLEQMAERLERR
jgi:hypothetical protein